MPINLWSEVANLCNKAQGVLGILHVFATSELQKSAVSQHNMRARQRSRDAAFSVRTPQGS